MQQPIPVSDHLTCRKFSFMLGQNLPPATCSCSPQPCPPVTENKSTPLPWDSIQTLEDNYYVLNLLLPRLRVSRSSNCPQFDLALGMSHRPQKRKGTLTTLHHPDLIALPKSTGLTAFTTVLIYGTLICSWTNIIIVSYNKAKKKEVYCYNIWIILFSGQQRS